MTPFAVYPACRHRWGILTPFKGVGRVVATRGLVLAYATGNAGTPTGVPLLFSTKRQALDECRCRNSKLEPWERTRRGNHRRFIVSKVALSYQP
jgi:hypothetical protein